MRSGSFNETRCSATACAATFSLVRTISWRLGSKTSNSARRALPRPIGVQAVSTLDSTAQPQPFSGHAQKDLPVLGHFWYPQYDKCFGTPWNAGSRTPVPASGARLHRGDGGAFPRLHGSKWEPTVVATTQSKCGLARHASKAHAGLAEACWY